MWVFFEEVFSYYRLPLWQRNRLSEFLIEAYSGPDRHYHNLEHINEALHIAYEMKDSCTNWHHVVLALLYHDFVYDTKAASGVNETMSANYLSAILANNGITKNFRNDRPNTAASHIMKTWMHNPQSSFDAKVVCDADLYRLASPDFDFHSDCIRKEYSWVPNDMYRVGRAKVLHSFLDRRTIFHTHYMRDMYEQAARDNLRRSLEALGEKVS